MRNHALTCATSNTSETLTIHSQNQSAIRHTKRYGHKPARHKDHNKTKPIWKVIVLCNTPPFKLKSKKTAKNNPSPIVIPSKTAKKFPKHYLQPTWKITFQHSKIEEQVQHAHPKNISKKASLCTQTAKTHARNSKQTRSCRGHQSSWSQDQPTTLSDMEHYSSTCETSYELKRLSMTQTKSHVVPAYFETKQAP